VCTRAAVLARISVVMSSILSFITCCTVLYNVFWNEQFSYSHIIRVYRICLTILYPSVRQFMDSKFIGVGSRGAGGHGPQ